MRITRFATPAALVALASAFTPSCESAECAEEVCFEGQGGSVARAGAGGAEAGQGGFSAAAGLSGTGGKTPTGGAGNSGTPGSGGSAGEGTAGSPEGGSDSNGEAGSGGEGGAVPVCDPTKAPSAEACLVSDEFAVFVSPLGTNEATGKRSDPLLSISSAIALAAVQQKVVIACNTDKAVFTVPLELTGELEARVYGGFDCGTWTHASTPTLVAPAERGPALTLEGVTGALTFEDFEFRSKDALDGDGESSIAAVVSKSDGVLFSRVLFAAGKGGRGRDGAPIEPYTTAAPDGHPANEENGGAFRSSAQCGCETEGGQGGNASGSLVNGAPGTPAYDQVSGKGGVGGTGDCTVGVGKNGAPAPTDIPYGVGADTHGTLTGTTWQPAPGKPGYAGKAGQGGGGGGGGKSSDGAGGGGACGGCGGKGGNAGGGGGSSIGVLLVDSEVAFRDTLITTSNAGAGGDGGPGQDGQDGGRGGLPSVGGCPGGAGGEGSSGSMGGGGAGGLSVGILFRGLAPTLEGLAISTGLLGSGGSGDPGGPKTVNGLDGDNPETFDAGS